MGSLGAMLTHPDDIYPLLKMKMAVRNAEKQIPPEPHWAFCYTTLHKVSRSFVLVIQQLDPELRNAVCIFYLVLRALDTDGVTAKIMDRTKTMSDVYGAFFDFAEVQVLEVLQNSQSKQVDNNDPIAIKTLNRVAAIEKACKDSGLLSTRRAYMVDSHPRYNSVLIMAIFILLAIFLTFSANRPTH